MRESTRNVQADVLCALPTISRRTWRAAVLELTLVVLLGLGGLGGVGCGHKKDRPSSYAAEVRGRVYLERKPLSSGTITFIPTTPESEGGRPGLARIESDGSYWVGNSNLDKTAGLKPGRYKVTILAMLPDPTGTGRPIARLVVPSGYAEPTITPLESRIVAGNNRLDFELYSSYTLPTSSTIETGGTSSSQSHENGRPVNDSMSP